MRVRRRLYLLHIPINCMKISLRVTELWSVQELFTVRQRHTIIHPFSQNRCIKTEKFVVQKIVKC